LNAWINALQRAPMAQITALKNVVATPKAVSPMDFEARAMSADLAVQEIGSS
jgi:hypothetical protein